MVEYHHPTEVNVGAPRARWTHLARHDTRSQSTYILHPQADEFHATSLADCPYSKALMRRSINLIRWQGFLDQTVVVYLDMGELIPAPYHGPMLGEPPKTRYAPGWPSAWEVARMPCPVLQSYRIATGGDPPMPTPLEDRLAQAFTEVMEEMTDATRQEIVARLVTVAVLEFEED